MYEEILMISVDRAKKIINCYGAHPSAWPEQERHAVQQLLLNYKNLKTLQKKAIVLDELIIHPEQRKLQNREMDHQCSYKIMAALPEQQKIEQISQPLINKDKQTFKYMALAASIAFTVIGISNNSLFSHTDTNIEQFSLSEHIAVYTNDFSVIEDEQLEMLAFLEPQILED